jgi:N-acetylglutamate synthase-like GNAT family acetyltransferase
MKIRKANIQDTNAIVEVIAPFVDAVISSEEGRQRFQPEMIQTIFERADIHYFVAEKEHQVIGVVAYMEPAHYYAFFPEPSLSGAGLWLENVALFRA